jgi:hypothetical protein
MLGSDMSLDACDDFLIGKQLQPITEMSEDEIALRLEHLQQ